MSVAAGACPPGGGSAGPFAVVAVVVLLGVCLLSWLILRVRVRRISARLRCQYESRLSERERIARQLHDGLLQGIQGLLLQVQAAADRLAPDDPARAALDAALDRGEDLLLAGRDRVFELRVSAVPPDDSTGVSAASADEQKDSRGP